MHKNELTSEQVRQVLHYEPDTGVFTWIRNGKVAGHHRSDGYFDIRVGDYLYRAHRLAWLYMTGAWPAIWIDHIDRDPSNTKWSNLREATISQNRQNQAKRKDSSRPYKGLELHEKGLWRARIVVRGKRIHLGYFKTPEEANQARIEGERLHFTHSPANAPRSSCPDEVSLSDEIG